MNFTKKLPDLILISTILLLCLCFFHASNVRLVARDEGFYVMAIKEILAGKTLYQDFFYPQMPLLPYLYAFFIKAFSLSWLNLRYISALFASLLAASILLQSKKNLGIFNTITIAIIFLICNFIYPWLTTVQVYALTTFLLTCACISISNIEANSDGDSKHNIDLLLGSFLFSCSVATRLYMGALFPVFFLYIWKKIGIRSALIFTFSGLIFGLILCLPFLLDFESFYFNNLTYHLQRSNFAPEKALANKLTVAAAVFGFKSSIKFDAYHIVSLYGAFIFGSLVAIYKKLPLPLAAWLCIALTFVNFIPTPTYVQYFVCNVPLIFLSIIYYLGNLDLNAKVKSTILGLLLAISLPYSYSDYLKHTKTGEGVIGILNQKNANHWNLKNINKIENFIDRNTKTNAYVFSLWSGYLLNTHTRPIPGLENHFSPLIGNQIDLDQRKKFKVVANADYLGLIEKYNPELIILPINFKYRKLMNLLRSDRYTILAKSSHLVFYKPV